MGKVMFMKKGEVHEAPVTVAVGTIWLFEVDGTFTVPATGKYQIEMHGGGGGSGFQTGDVSLGYTSAAAGGGGSGEIYEVELVAGESHDISIGAGGTYGNQVSGSTGGTTTFGSLFSLAGGGGGTVNIYGTNSGGTASGSIAGAGSVQRGTGYAAGGYGNEDNTSQTYGNGGFAAHGASSGYGDGTIAAGRPGAVIITYLGKE